MKNLLSAAYRKKNKNNLSLTGIFDKMQESFIFGQIYTSSKVAKGKIQKIFSQENKNIFFQKFVQAYISAKQLFSYIGYVV